MFELWIITDGVVTSEWCLWVVCLWCFVCPTGKLSWLICFNLTPDVTLFLPMNSSEYCMKSPRWRFIVFEFFMQLFIKVVESRDIKWNARWFVIFRCSQAPVNSLFWHNLINLLRDDKMTFNDHDQTLSESSFHWERYIK